MLNMWPLLPIRKKPFRGGKQSEGLGLIWLMTRKFQGSSLGLSFPPKLKLISE